ncbi:MAG: pstB [Rhodospirillales bacterium]|nr:pstB [Rhodospirillales bacterium]
MDSLQLLRKDTEVEIATAAGPTAFEIDELTAGYRERRVLRGISCCIPERRVTAIMGPSGCGKSTLVKALNRTLELMPGGAVTSGHVRFRGADLHGPAVDPRAVRRSLGIIHQQPVPFPMSILENVVFGARFHAICRRAEREAYARLYLEKVGLWTEVKHQLHESASRFSGGQQQRLCLARTLANQPQAVLMDEPCSALDPYATRRIEEHIVELRDEYPVIVVTHNVGQARRISDYVLFMVDGQLIEAGPTAQVFEAPQSQLARDFISGRFG